MLLLNLGCGSKTSDKPGVVNIDRSLLLRARNSKLLALLVPVVLRGERLARYRSLPANVRVHDLSKGVPYADSSVDAVYHSHLLEHLDRDIGEQFLREVLRVLKPGGVHRIVVPDLETICREYIEHLEASINDPSQASDHDQLVAGLIEQSVRKEAAGTAEQSPIRRRLENLFLRDARKRGETHQWMYDRVNLTAKLQSVGYTAVHAQDYGTSLIPDWQSYGLDTNNDGTVYKPGSLYVEAVK